VPHRKLVHEDRALDRIGPIVDAAHVGGDAVIFEVERHDSQASLEMPVLFRRGFLRKVLDRLR
jgi:hypothetical protein